MDDKYTGCNIVESVVTCTPPKRVDSDKKVAENKPKSHIFARLIISAIIISFILVLHYVPSLPFASGVTDVLRKVFCYDVFGRASFGTALFG